MEEVYHSSELPYLYGNISPLSSEASKNLSSMMKDYWISFATSQKSWTFYLRMRALYLCVSAPTPAMSNGRSSHLCCGNMLRDGYPWR